MRRAILPLLLLAVFLPSAAFAHTQFLCGDQLVRESCCCPPKRHSVPQVPVLQRDCCKLVKHTPIAPQVAIEHDADLAAPVAVAIAAAPVMPPLVDARIAVAPRAQAPPLLPTLLAQHAALLV